MQHSLDDWAKSGKRPMTSITITDTSPPITKVTEIKDFAMIYLWNLISDQVAGNAIEFSKRTEVIISEQKRDFELTPGRRQSSPSSWRSASRTVP